MYKACLPSLSTLFNYLATWGPAEVTLNGEPFENPFDGPTPLWVGHTMTSVGARFTDGTVRETDGSFHSPCKKSSGITEHGDLEYHIVFHDAPNPGSPTANFPPPLSFFYHVMFEGVQFEVKHREVED
jgi:hypothetical protein